MTTYRHQQLCDDIARLDTCPEDENEFARWCRASGHLELLAENCDQDELIIAMRGPYSYLRSLFVDRTTLEGTTPDALIKWQPRRDEGLMAYSAIYPSGAVNLVREYSREARQFLLGAESPVFRRSIEGVSDEYGQSWEPRQEYLHVINAHWRPERKAYSKIDKQGDWLDLICITTPKFDEVDGITLVSFQRDALDQYLAIRDMVVVQMLDFTLYRKPFSKNASWHINELSPLRQPRQFLFRQRTGSGVVRTRGVQIVPPRLTRPAAEQQIRDDNFWSEPNEFVEFIVHDFRNEEVCSVSTNPASTTTDFDAKGNNLPFEISPAFFDPEVLSRYKADQDKYRIVDNCIYCRSVWDLQYHVNDANQISVYICDLRNLPVREQRYWQSFNEKPKAGLSENAITTDFLGKWLSEDEPLPALKHILQTWHGRQVPWWRLIDQSALNRITVPVSESPDEWQNSILILCATIVDGFEVKHLRKEIKARGGDAQDNLRSLGLLRLLTGKSENAQPDKTLLALHELQRLRSKGGKTHAVSQGGSSLAQEVKVTHGTFRAHFEDLCTRLADDLLLIQRVLTDNESSDA